MERDKCIIKRVSDDQLKELEKILKMAASSDIETQLLAYNLFKEIFPKNSYFDATSGYFYSVSLIRMDELALRAVHSFTGDPFVIGSVSLRNAINNILIEKGYYISKYEKD